MNILQRLRKFWVEHSYPKYVTRVGYVYVTFPCDWETIEMQHGYDIVYPTSTYKKKISYVWLEEVKS